MTDFLVKAVTICLLIVFASSAHSVTRHSVIIEVNAGLVDQIEFFLAGEQIEKMGGGGYMQLNMIFLITTDICCLSTSIIQGLFSS
ncbi:MAG: hypothetical protein LBT18_03455 [Endomicrobium sp.]|jgi:hypothetical protein|nr:hypothetical protein [Endomicrobium sp.]